MNNNLIQFLQEDNARWDKIKDLFQEKEIPAKTVLLHEGYIAQYIYFIKKGCLRMWFNNDGKDITFQFFFENQGVASIESFLGNNPSSFSIESIEPTTVIQLSKENFHLLGGNYPQLKEKFQEILLQRMGNYAQLFLSRIKDSPRVRYEDLVENHPEIIQRVPQHYIASYLGITPISLSRIKNNR